MHFRPSFLSPRVFRGSPMSQVLAIRPTSISRHIPGGENGRQRLPPLHPSATPLLRVPSTVTLRDRIGNLCLRLRKARLARTPRVPRRFTFTEEEIFRSRLEPNSSHPGFCYDWRCFPSPHTKVLSAFEIRQLLRTTHSRPLSRRLGKPM